MGVNYYVEILLGAKKEEATAYINVAGEQFDVSEDGIMEVLFDMSVLKTDYNGVIQTLGYELDGIGEEETVWELEQYSKEELSHTIEEQLEYWRIFFNQSPSIEQDAALWVYKQALRNGSVLISGRWS